MIAPGPKGTNMLRRSLCLAPVGICALVALAVALARAQDDEDFFEDEVIRHTHAPVIGVKITKDNWKVVYAVKGEGGVTIPASDVAETVYADASPDLLRGFERVKRGYYSKAITKSFEPTINRVKRFRKVEGKPWPLQYCLYYLGVSHLRRGERGDAAKARGYFERLIKEVPQSRFIFAAYTGIGDAHQVEKKYTAAAAAFGAAKERFEKMSRTGGLKMDVVTAIRRRALEAHFRQGEMFDLAGEKDRTMWDRAVSVFNSVAANASRNHPDIEYRANSAAIKALVSLKSYKLAIKNARKLIAKGEKEGYTEFLGGAYLGLADCYFIQYTDAEENDKGADPADLVVARYNYLRVLALYFEDRTVLPKAHYRAGRCYERLAQAGEGPKATDRAVRHYSRIIAEWPGDDWSKEAKARLTALGREPEIASAGAPRKTAEKPGSKTRKKK